MVEMIQNERTKHRALRSFLVRVNSFFEAFGAPLGHSAVLKDPLEAPVSALFADISLQQRLQGAITTPSQYQPPGYALHLESYPSLRATEFTRAGSDSHSALSYC